GRSRMAGSRPRQPLAKSDRRIRECPRGRRAVPRRSASQTGPSSSNGKEQGRVFVPADGGCGWSFPTRSQMVGGPRGRRTGKWFAASVSPPTRDLANHGTNRSAERSHDVKRARPALVPTGGAGGGQICRENPMELGSHHIVHLVMKFPSKASASKS